MNVIGSIYLRERDVCNFTCSPADLKKIRDLSQRTLQIRELSRIANCRGKREKSRFITENGKIAIPQVPRFSFVLDTFKSLV